MAVREVDAITDAIIETEREIAGDAWGLEETERDPGDNSLEEMGEGLEGQHELEDEDESEVEETEEEEESEEVVEPAIAAKPGEPAKPEVTAPTERNLVPPGKLREANEARRALEAERDALKAELTAKGDTKALADKLDMALREIAALKAPRVEPKANPVDKPKRPDLFEDPDGALAFMEQGVQQQIAPLISQIQNMRVENSMAIAHATHKDTFAKAYEWMTTKLNPQNPDDLATGRRIVNSPNPGEALVAAYKRNETFARVGDDPAKFEENIRNQTREALMKDPEFIKQIVAAARGEALQGDNGSPRTVTRIPKSLNGVVGSNVGADRGSHQSDDSEQGIADSVWR